MRVLHATALDALDLRFHQRTNSVLILEEGQSVEEQYCEAILISHVVRPTRRVSVSLYCIMQAFQISQ